MVQIVRTITQRSSDIPSHGLAGSKMTIDLGSVSLNSEQERSTSQ